MPSNEELYLLENYKQFNYNTGKPLKSKLVWVEIFLKINLFELAEKYTDMTECN